MPWVICYQLLTGDLGMLSVPTEWMEQVRKRGLGEDLVGLLGSCIAPRAEQRPANAVVLAERLSPLPARIDKPAASVRPPVGQQLPHGEPETRGPGACVFFVLALVSGFLKQHPEYMPALLRPKPPSEPILAFDPQPGTRVGEVATNSLKTKFAWVPPGNSWLGGGGGKPGTKEFTLSRGLWCGVYPVTQAEWQAVMGKNPSRFSWNPQYPVHSVSWDDVQEFLKTLNGRSQSGGLTYRSDSAKAPLLVSERNDRGESLDGVRGEALGAPHHQQNCHNRERPPNRRRRSCSRG